MTADVTREPTGGQGLREAIVDLLESRENELAEADADAVLALPEIAALIADAERVQRVNGLCDIWENRGDLYEKAGEMWRAGRLRQRAADVRRALSEPQP